MGTTALTIGSAASASGVPVKTIRYYEEIGLIPRARRSNGSVRTGGNRIFDAESVGRLRFIRAARTLGLSLRDVRRLVEIAEQGCPSDRSAYRGILRQHLAGIDTHIARLAELRAQIRRLLSRKRSAALKACCWESCDCLSADTATKRGNSNKKASDRDQRNGEDHVRTVWLHRS